MNKKFISAFMLGLLTLGTAGTITSCKDYDGDLGSVKQDVNELQKQIATLQSALDQAKSEANAAHATFALKSDLNDLKTEVAKLVTAAQLQKAIDDCQAALKGGYNGTMKDLANSIDAIDSKLNTLGSTLNDPQTGLAAAHANIKAQKEALDAYKTEVAKLLGTKVDQATYDAEVKKIETALTALENADKSLSADIKQLKSAMEAANSAIDKLGANLNVLTAFVNKRLTSLVLRPDMYYGGIEGVNIFSLKSKTEKMYDEYHYFMDAKNDIDISDLGSVNYHINPATADLTGSKLGFYSWQSDIIEPATTEASRATAGDKGLVWSVYNTYADLVKNVEQPNGIITVPFKAKTLDIDKALAKSVGTIMALQVTKNENGKDTTVTSDYALVVPRHGYQLLIGDVTFVNEKGLPTHNDKITKYSDEVEYGTVRKDDDKADNNHLHRSFDYLAKSNVPATHEVLYNGDGLDITNILTTYYLNTEEHVKDTAVLTPHVGSWQYASKTKATIKNDGDASVDPKFVNELTPKQLEALGLYYDIHYVNYTLGTTQTDETAHIQLKTDANGHVWAKPCKVTYETGERIEDQPADKGSIGRMPMICIELKKIVGAEKDPAKDQIVSFAYMKLLITDKVEAIQTEFDLSDIYADCNETLGAIKWHNFEVRVLDELTKMSKETFDATYKFEAYKTETGDIQIGDVTYKADFNLGTQYTAADVNKKAATKDIYGVIRERRNYTEGGKEDPTTHVLEWYFDKENYWKLFNDLDKAGKLVDNGDDTYVNVDPIVRWVRYVLKNNEKSAHCIWVKMTIPAKKYHFAKGTFENKKILSYWYELNSNVNAPSEETAMEVRVNVPVPTPGTPGVSSSSNKTVLGGEKCVDADKAPYVAAKELLTTVSHTTELAIWNDNVLGSWEFIKDLHDYFVDGNLTASITDKKNFPNLAKTEFVPEFQFTTPSKAVGNASFDANKGEWRVAGISGHDYILVIKSVDGGKNNAIVATTKIKDNKVVESFNIIVACLSKDKNGVQSVIKYHQNHVADDILNYKGHKELGEQETFTAYIKIVTDDVCAPVKFNKPWFNVRFIRPLEMQDTKNAIVPDAPNDWQYVALEWPAVVDWRNYTGDPKNTVGGKDAGSKFDFAYYQIVYGAAADGFMTDAQLGTAERNNEFKAIAELTNINDAANAAYAKKLIKTSSVPNLDFQVVKLSDIPSASVKKEWYSNMLFIKYKNNSGVVGNFQVFVPVKMRYVFGQDELNENATQVKWLTIGVSSSVDQPMQSK